MTKCVVGIAPIIKFITLKSSLCGVTITDSESFKSKVRIRVENPEDCNTKDFKREVLLQYLSCVWRTL